MVRLTSEPAIQSAGESDPAFGSSDQLSTISSNNSAASLPSESVEVQVFIVNFNARSDHSVEEAEGWRLELHDIGFAGHDHL